MLLNDAYQGRLRPWLECIPDCCPVFINVETTGVQTDDILSAVSMLPACADNPIFMPFTMSDSWVDKALRFLFIDKAQYDSLCVSEEGVKEMLRSLANGTNLPILPLTYNAPFQNKFLARRELVSDLVAEALWFPMLDVTRLCWCADNGRAGHIRDIQHLAHEVESRSYRQKGVGYKDLMPKKGVTLPDPLVPWEKPRLVKETLLRQANDSGSEPLPIEDLFNLPALDPERWNTVWRRIISRHGQASL